MRAVFALRPEALRRLVAKGTVAEPIVQEAYQNGKIIIAGGITNAYVAEELTGQNIYDKWRYTVGVITHQGLGVTATGERIPAICLEKGKVLDIPWNEYLPELTSSDVIVKGCNAFDNEKRVGVFLGGTGGGTVGLITGWISAKGINLVVPATHDKLVPSVPNAAEWLGIDRTDLCTGMKVGMGIFNNATLVTETRAITNIFGLSAAVVGGGGYDGAQGAVVLAAEGTEDQISRLWALIEQIKDEKAIKDIITE